jgi:hypothetical protein
MSEQRTPDERAAKAERLLQAAERWRDKYKPIAPECCWQSDRCVVNAPELVEEAMNVVGYCPYE